MAIFWEKFNHSVFTPVKYRCLPNHSLHTHIPALLFKNRAKRFILSGTNKYYLEIIILNTFSRSRHTMLCEMFQTSRPAKQGDVFLLLRKESCTKHSFRTSGESNRKNTSSFASVSTTVSMSFHEPPQRKKALPAPPHVSTSVGRQVWILIGCAWAQAQPCGGWGDVIVRPSLNHMWTNKEKEFPTRSWLRRNGDKGMSNSHQRKVRGVSGDDQNLVPATSHMRWGRIVAVRANMH